MKLKQDTKGENGHRLLSLSYFYASSGLPLSARGEEPVPRVRVNLTLAGVQAAVGGRQAH